MSKRFVLSFTPEWPDHQVGTDPEVVLLLAAQLERAYSRIQVHAARGVVGEDRDVDRLERMGQCQRLLDLPVEDFYPPERWRSGCRPNSGRRS